MPSTMNNTSAEIPWRFDTLMANKANIKIDFTVNKEIPSDVNGSYTGVPADGGVPVQDSDDL